MNNTITVGSPAYKSIVARVNWLERQCDQRLLTPQEHAEYKRERAKLEQAELQHSMAQAGAHT